MSEEILELKYASLASHPSNPDCQRNSDKEEGVQIQEREDSVKTGGFPCRGKAGLQDTGGRKKTSGSNLDKLAVGGTWREVSLIHSQRVMRLKNNYFWNL